MKKKNLEIRKMILLLAKERLNELTIEGEEKVKKIESGFKTKSSDLEYEKRMLSHWKATSDEVEIWKNEVIRLL